MRNARRIQRGTPESRAFVQRVQTVLELTSQLNVLPFADTETRTQLISEILERQMPPTLTIYPPFYCDYGLGLDFGERVFVNQGCSFFDLGGITIGDRVMFGPHVTLTTAGHPVELADRYEYLTMAPIVIEDDVWIGAAATIAPGVTIGRGSVVGAGAVIANDVPPMTVATGVPGTEQRSLHPSV